MAKRAKKSTRAMRDRRGKAKDGDQSRYGRKKAYLRAHGGWGFEYLYPKPWAS